MRRLSLVVPCFNESVNIPELRRRLSALPAFQRGEVEIVGVDDGSTDDTWELLAAWAREEPRVVAVKLEGNQGNQRAMLSGISAAGCSTVGVLDADLQDPPETLLEMAELLERERLAAVVGLKAVRRDRSRWLAMLKDLAALPLPFRAGEGDFCVVDRRAADAILLGDLAAPFRVLRRRAVRGRPVSFVRYERSARVGGQTSFGLAALARLWWRILFALLSRTGPAEPLRIATVLRR